MIQQLKQNNRIEYKFGQILQMIFRKNHNRPLSRLDYNSIAFEQAAPVPLIAGIPQKYFSFSKKFPNNDQQSINKQNCPAPNAPKKQQKVKNILQIITGQSGSVSKKLGYQQNSNILKNRKINILTQRQNQNSILDSKQIENLKICEVLRRKSQSLNNQQKVKVVDERGGKFLKVKQRIRQREKNLNKNEERRKSIGQSAYIPYPLSILKQKIALKNKKPSQVLNFS